MNYLTVLYADSELYELDFSRQGGVTVGGGENDSLRLDRAGLLPGHWILDPRSVDEITFGRSVQNDIRPSGPLFVVMPARDDLQLVFDNTIKQPVFSGDSA
jgi:hypothetical protein